MEGPSGVPWRVPWSVCEVWSVECGVWSVECGVWGVECGVWSVECGVWSGTSADRRPVVRYMRSDAVDDAIRLVRCDPIRCGAMRSGAMRMLCDPMRGEDRAARCDPIRCERSLMRCRSDVTRCDPIDAVRCRSRPRADEDETENAKSGGWTSE